MTVLQHFKIELLRLARNCIKDELRAQGVKISSVSAKDITLAAKALLVEAVKDYAKDVAERKP